MQGSSGGARFGKQRFGIREALAESQQVAFGASEHARSRACR
jgi:hypothetical protein